MDARRTMPQAKPDFPRPRTPISESGPEFCTLLPLRAPSVLSLRVDRVRSIGRLFCQSKDVDIRHSRKERAPLQPYAGVRMDPRSLPWLLSRFKEAQQVTSNTRLLFNSELIACQCKTYLGLLHTSNNRPCSTSHPLHITNNESTLPT